MAQLTQDQIDTAKDKAYALGNAVIAFKASLRELENGHPVLITPNDHLQAIYILLGEAAQALTFNINTDGDEGCPPCNTIPFDERCIGCPMKG